MRDHNGAIVKQFEKVVAGRARDINPSFTISGNQVDGQTLTFTANATCSTGLEYSWSFGDNTTTAFAAFTGPATHTYNTNGKELSYQVTLRTRISGQSKVYESYQFIDIRPRPLTLTTCTNGIIAIDNCGEVPNRLANTCDGNSPATANTTFSVWVHDTGTYTYSWQSTVPGLSTWQGISGATSPSITVSPSTQSPASSQANARQLYRCTISNASGTIVGVSEDFSIEHYSSRGTQQNPCPVQ